MSGIMTLRLLDMSDIKELSFDAARRERTCSARLVLNSGTRGYVYRLWPTSDGTSFLVELE
jgi:hypothetical protein